LTGHWVSVANFFREMRDVPEAYRDRWISKEMETVGLTSEVRKKFAAMYQVRFSTGNLHVRCGDSKCSQIASMTTSLHYTIRFSLRQHIKIFRLLMYRSMAWYVLINTPLTYLSQARLRFTQQSCVELIRVSTHCRTSSVTTA